MEQITKEEFISMYYKETNVDISKRLKVSRQTIHSWAKKFNLSRKSRKKLIKETLDNGKA